MKNILLTTLASCILPLHVLADTVSVDFDTFPGHDCVLETALDVPTTHHQNVSNQYRCVGAIFSLIDGTAPIMLQRNGGRVLSPTHAPDAQESDIKDIVIEFTTPVSRVKLTAMDVDEAVTLRAFNAAGVEISIDYQPPTGDVAVETIEVSTDGTQGYITKVIVDVSEEDPGQCCSAGPEFYDFLEFDPIAVPSQCKLYAVHDEGLNDSYFLTIDPDDHFKVCPLHSGGYLGYDIESLAIHPTTGVIYVASGKHSAQAGSLYQLDGQTGTLTLIGQTGFNEVDGLSFAPDGTLWGWAQGVGLLTVDINTAVATVEVPYTGEIEDIAWNPAGTQLYAVANLVNAARDYGVRLLTYTVATDTIAVVCENAAVQEIEALDILADGSLLFGFHAAGDLQLGALNPMTCAVEVTQTIATPFNDIEGIAWNACP